MKKNKRFEDPTRRDWVIGIGLIVIFLVMIGVGAVLLVPGHIYWWILLVLIGILLLTFNQYRNYACRCRSCGYEFEIGFLAHLASPHGIDREGSWLYSKCPSCEIKAKLSVIRIARDP